MSIRQVLEKDILHIFSADSAHDGHLQLVAPFPPLRIFDASERVEPNIVGLLLDRKQIRILGKDVDSIDDQLDLLS